MKLTSQNIWDATHPAFSPESIDVPEAFRKVMEGIGQEGKEARRHEGRAWRIWSQVCSVIAVPALALAIFFGATAIERGVFEEQAAGTQTTTTPYGTRTEMTLPDGSHVWLNSGSSLTYPLAFNDGTRTVNLSGEAFFEVESDSEHPFIVKTKSIDVRATGTAFNVKSYESDSITSVMLERGKVNVSAGGSAEGITLAPGNLLSLNEMTGNTSVKEVDPYPYISWRDGVLIFIDTPMTEVFKRLGQIYNVDFVIGDPSLASHLYRATFDGDSLNDILDIMFLSSSISWHKSVSPSGRKTIEVYVDKERS